MTPDSVFVDNTEVNEEHLLGSDIGATKLDTPIPKTAGEVTETINSHFSQYPKIDDFYKMIRHYGRVSKSKKDTKEQFCKVFEIYISAMKQTITKDSEFEALEEITKSMETTKKLLANFVDGSKIENDYFRAGLAALLVNILH